MLDPTIAVIYIHSRVRRPGVLFLPLGQAVQPWIPADCSVSEPRPLTLQSSTEPCILSFPFLNLCIVNLGVSVAPIHVLCRSNRNFFNIIISLTQ